MAGCRLEREYAEKIGKPVEIFYQEKEYPLLKSATILCKKRD